MTALQATHVHALCRTLANTARVKFAHACRRRAQTVARVWKELGPIVASATRVSQVHNVSFF